MIKQNAALCLWNKRNLYLGSFLSLNGTEQRVRQGPQSTSSTVINLKTAFCAGGKKKTYDIKNKHQDSFHRWLLKYLVHEGTDVLLDI